MTLERFIKLVYDNAKAEGQPYIAWTDRGELRALIEEQIDVYCSRSACLQSDRITFTPSVGVSAYSMRDTAIVSQRVAFVRQVMLGGAWLKIYGDDHGEPGESSEGIAIRDLDSHLTAANSKPTTWWQEPPYTLVFNCPLASVYTHCFIAGTLYHSEFLSDQQELDLGPEDVRPCARWCAAELLMPLSRDKAIALRNVVEAELEEREAESSRKLGGNSRRGPALSRKKVILT